MKIFAKHKWIKLIVIGIGIVIVAIVVFIVLNAESGKRKTNKYIDEGNQYLTELEYKSAIASYKKAIRINPNAAEAYIGLADAYIGLEKYSRAESILEDGISVLPSDDNLLDKLDEVQKLIDVQAKEQDVYTEQTDDSGESNTENYFDAEESNKITWVKVKALEYSDGKPKSATEYEYDDNWNLVKVTVYANDLKTVNELYEYEYDNQGKNQRIFLLRRWRIICIF